MRLGTACCPVRDGSACEVSAAVAMAKYNRWIMTKNNCELTVAYDRPGISPGQSNRTV